MEKLPPYYFSWIVSFQKQRYMRDASSGDKTLMLNDRMMSENNLEGHRMKHHSLI